MHFKSFIYVIFLFLLLLNTIDASDYSPVINGYMGYSFDIDTTYSEVFPLKGGGTLTASLDPELETAFYLRWESEKVDTLIRGYNKYLSFYIEEIRESIFDFDNSFAVLHKVGSNVYFSLYDKESGNVLIDDQFLYVIDTLNQVILFWQNPSEEGSISHTNPIHEEDADFSICDVLKKKKTFIDPFVNCEDFYGGFSYFHITIEAVTEKEIVLRYGDCLATVER